MNYDRLDKRLAFERRDTAKDSLGGQVNTWAPLLDRWGSIRQLEGRELLAAQALHAEVTHEISVIYTPQIAARDRIQFKGRYFEIIAAWDVDEDGEETRIRAKEGLTQG